MSLLERALGAFVGGLFGFPAVLAYYALFSGLGLPLSCTASFCFSPIYDGVFLSLPALLLLLCGFITFRFLRGHPISSPFTDSLLFTFGVVFDLFAFYMLYTFSSSMIPG